MMSNFFSGLAGVGGGALARADTGMAGVAIAHPLFRPEPRAPRVRPHDPDLRLGVIRNGKARLNIGRYGLEVGRDAERAAPDSLDELDGALRLFAARRVNALVIDGGDGTIRDVLTAAARHFGGSFPRVALVPSGKTNALAVDLGIPLSWTEEAAVAALRAGRVTERSPLEVHRPASVQAEHRGFILGAGAFVRATALAQTTHRLGAFNGLAVGLSVAGGVAQTLFGGGDNIWRRGTAMRIGLPGAKAVESAKYMLFASTLDRLPLGLRPFGASRPGLKLLSIDAPPRKLVAMLPALLAGYDLPALGGYRRDDADRVELSIDGDIVLDGETYAGGAMTLVRGAPIGFAVP